MTVDGQGTTDGDVPGSRVGGQSQTSVLQILKEYVHGDPGLGGNRGR